MEAKEKLEQERVDSAEMDMDGNASSVGNRKQPLFKASIGGGRPLLSQSQSAMLSQNDEEDLDGQGTPAGPIPKSKGGPVPLMSLEVKPPTPQEDVDEEKEENSSLLPKALEQALALKTERAHEMGVHPEDIAQVRYLATLDGLFEYGLKNYVLHYLLIL